MTTSATGRAPTCRRTRRRQHRRRPRRSCQRIDDRYAAAIAPSLVFITFDMPYAVSGVTERNYHGTGLIIDAERGLLITDRNTVPVSARRCAADLRRHARDSRRDRLCASAA
jgi:hypothetical protein